MSSNLIELEYIKVNDIDRIKLIGRLGAAVKADVSAELAAVIDRGDIFLHLDLTELEFVDSAGLSALVSLLKHARKLEGDVILYNANDRITALLELTRLHEIFELREDSQLPTASGFS